MEKWVIMSYEFRYLSPQLIFVRWEGVASAKDLGWTRFTIASDPYAEGFYVKMGATRVGERESKIKKGFFLPLLEFSIRY